MLKTLSAAGIRRYMDEQALTLTPANTSWKISSWFATGPGAYVFMGVLALCALGSSFGPTAQFVTTLVLAAIIPGLLIALLITSTQRMPGFWQRYSLFQGAKKYPDLGVHINAYALLVRKENPDAEFEVVILEQQEKLHGAVLFQVSGRNLAGEAERVVQVFSDYCSPVQFSSRTSAAGMIG